MSIPDGRREDKQAQGGWSISASRGQDEAFPSEPSRKRHHFYTEPLFWTICVLVGTQCIGLGLVAGKERADTGGKLWIEQLPGEEVVGSASSTAEVPPVPPVPIPSEAAAAAGTAGAATVKPPSTGGTYVASKSGSKYYLPSCAAAVRIKDENKVWFATKAAAEAAGYEPSATCKGL